jgi:CheY-like chemotaxis protein
MAISFSCECGKILSAPDAGVGKKGRCPVCGRLVVVPKPPEPPPQEKAAQQAAVQAAVQAAPKRVLIGDASAEDLKSTVAMFKEHDYDVAYAGGDATKIIEKIRELKPDVAVLDMKLVGMKAFQLIETLRDPLNRKNSDVLNQLFVMTTDDLHGRDKQYARRLGVEIYVEKPLVPVKVFPRIERRLERRRRVI